MIRGIGGSTGPVLSKRGHLSPVGFLRIFTGREELVAMSAENQIPDHRFYAFLEALLGTQKRLVETTGRMTNRVDVLTTEVEKSNRQYVVISSDVASLKNDLASLKNDLGSFRAESGARADGLSRLLDEIEQVAERIGQDVKATRIELVGQQNDILNALQSGLIARLDVEDLRERIDELERHLGM
jgi:archaellum component FlaC